MKRLLLFVLVLALVTIACGSTQPTTRTIVVTATPQPHKAQSINTPVPKVQDFPDLLPEITCPFTERLPASTTEARCYSDGDVFGVLFFTGSRLLAISIVYPVNSSDAVVERAVFFGIAASTVNGWDGDAIQIAIDIASKSSDGEGWYGEYGVLFQLEDGDFAVTIMRDQ